MPGIGILSSIDYSARMQASFDAGLNMSPLPYIAPPQDGLGYGTSSLNAGLDNLAQDSNVSLIVTFGGLMPCLAAIAHSARPFISLVGGLGAPGFVNPPNNRFLGCISLDSFVLDEVRIAWLHTQGYAAANIGLLYNSQSVMGPLEAAAWGGGQTVDAVNGWNNPTHFDQDFDNFGGAITAIVISADPYFQRHREDLIPAANNSAKYICYPFRGYANRNGTHQPTRGRAVIIGPDLVANNQDGAYFLTGAMAAAVGLVQPTAPNPAINKGVAQVIWPL
jgi:hypothetical protein